MKRKFTFLLAAMLLMSGLTWAQTTETLNIEEYASANSWTNGTQYLSAEVGAVTFTAIGGSNTGKYYSSDQSWRFYANENATLTISVPSGNSLVSVTPTFTTKDNGILVFEGETVTSGSTVSVSSEELVFTISQSSGNKGKVFFTEIEVAYTSGGTPNPSITAANVEIAYDATSGIIEYTINNPAGGNLTAATESEWLTLGTVGTTIPFTCTTNQAIAARTATVTLTYTYNTDQTTTKNITVTQEGNPNAIMSISDITATGTYTVQGTIVAKSQRGFVVGDGTGYVYYYNQNYTEADYTIGDMVKLAGPVVVYGGVYEFNSSTTITAATSSNYVAEDPTVLTGEQMDARVASTTPPQLSSYVQYEGTLSINGTHYNITDIVGAATAIGSISYPLNTEEITALDGKHVRVTGYYVGISTGTYYNTMLGSVEEIANNNPSITAEDVSVDYDATTGAIEYTINNPVSGGVLTAAMEESEWLTLGTVGTTVPFTCTANPTAATRTVTVTLTYTYNTDQFVTKNVTVTQAGNPNIIDNISDITAAGEYTVQGTIVAINNRGFILGDGTGYVYYYYGSTGFESGDYDIGDMVKLAGTVIVYGGVFEFNNTTTITYVSESNYVAEDPTVLSGADMDARVASTTPAQLSSYVQYEGTLSISNNFYNITDILGATTAIGSISYPLNTEEITALDGKQVKVTGYYVGVSSSTYYNTMIGSIEEVEVQHEQYTLTVSNLVDVNTYVFDAANQNDMLLEGEGSVQIYDGTQVLISVDVEDGYVLQSLVVDGVDVTSQIDETGAYTFFMPTHNVTVSATAVVVPPFEPATYTLATTIESGKTYIIVGSKEIEGETNYYAMGEQRGNNRGGYAISVEGTTATVETADVHEVVITALDEEGFYSIYDGGYLYAAGSNKNYLRTQDSIDVNAQWSISIDSVFHIVADSSANRNVMQFNYNGGSPLFSCYASASQSPVYLYVKDEVPTTVTQTVALEAGNNWFSANVEITLNDLKAALVEVSPNNAITIQGQTDNVKYNPNNHRWTGRLNALDLTQMYMISVGIDCEIALEGMPVDPAEYPIVISNGANWIAYPFSSESMTLTNAFNGFAVTGDLVQSQISNSKYNRNRWQGQLTTLEPGKGYIYNSAATETRTFTYPTAK